MLWECLRAGITCSQWDDDPQKEGDGGGDVGEEVWREEEPHHHHLFPVDHHLHHLIIHIIHIIQIKYQVSSNWQIPYLPDNLRCSYLDLLFNIRGLKGL